MSSYKILKSIELRSIVAATLFLYLSVFLFSCQSDILDEVPADAGVRSVGVFEQDSFSLKCKTLFEEALRTDGVSNALLGFSGINDTISQSTYSFATDFSLPPGAINLPAINNLEVQSVKLHLNFFDFYGDFDENMEIACHMLDEAMDTGNYFNDEISRLKLAAGMSFTQVVKPDPINLIQVNNEEEPPSLILELPVEWGELIMQNRGTAFESNEDFKKVFPGLLVEATRSNTNGGGIAILNLTSEFSRLVIEFQDKFYADDALNSKYRLEFPIDENNSRVSFFEHNFSSLAQDIVQQETSANAVYVQSSAAFKSLIEIPSLTNWEAGSNLIVNSAILELPAKSIDNDSYPNLDRLYLITQSADGRSQFIPDLFRGSNSYGGIYDAVNNKYQFNILEYIQGVIDNKFENNGLLLIDGAGYFGRSYNPRRIVLFGPNGDQEKMNFRISYSIN